jgi:hypothetical protein
MRRLKRIFRQASSRLTVAGFKVSAGFEGFDLKALLSFAAFLVEGRFICVIRHLLSRYESRGFQ